MSGVVDYVRDALGKAYARIMGAPKKDATPAGAPSQSRAMTTATQNQMMMAPVPGPITVVPSQTPMVIRQPVVKPEAPRITVKTKFPPKPSRPKPAKKAAPKKPAARKAPKRKKSP